MGGQGQGQGRAPQVLGYQLTLLGPRGADHALHITAGPPPIFLDDAASLLQLALLSLQKNKVIKYE